MNTVKSVKMDSLEVTNSVTLLNDTEKKNIKGGGFWIEEPWRRM